MTPKIPKVGDLFYWRDQRSWGKGGGERISSRDDDLWDCVWLLMDVEKSYEQTDTFAGNEFVWIFSVLLIREAMQGSNRINRIIWDDDSVQHAYILIQST